VRFVKKLNGDCRVVARLHVPGVVACAVLGDSGVEELLVLKHGGTVVENLGSLGKILKDNKV
jgi:hypothetical protein